VRRELVQRLRARTVTHTALAPNVGEYSGLGERVLGHLFDKQLALVRDKARRKSAKCGRRAGKTTTAAAYLCKDALDFAGSLNGYIAPTRKQAKRLLWRELKRLNRHYALGATFNETELEAYFPNGSIILLAGADKEDTIEKFRGSAFKLVVIDEGASFKSHIEKLVGDVLKPTLEDYAGSILLIGTPGTALIGMFYDATTTAHGWERHHWTVLDNPRFPQWAGRDNWRELALQWLARLREENAYTEDDPTYQREWLGRWTRDVTTLVYPYDPARNLVTTLPPGIDWKYGLGIDIGTTKDTAFVVEAYAPRVDPNCYIVHAEKRPGMDVTDMAERTKELKAMWKFSDRIADCGGLGKMIVKELNQRHHLAIEAAEKQGKAAFQAVFAADLRKGRTKVLPEALGIVTEWEQIQKGPDGDEDDRFPNHLSDAALYVHRRCRHYVFEPTAAVPELGSEEHYRREEDRLVRELERDLTERDEVETLWG
jgi:hypothetical protein